MTKAEPDHEQFLILGGDQQAALLDWHEPEKVLELATVAVVERVNWSRNAIAVKIARLRGTDAVRYLDMPLIQVSSSSVRRRARQGKPIRDVPEDVVSLIVQGPLRRAEEGRGSAHERRLAPGRRRARRAHRGDRRRQEGDRYPRDRPARDRVLHRLLRDLLWAEASARPRRSTTRSTRKLKHDKERLLPRRTEGNRESRWILLDYWDVVAHIFTPRRASTTRLESPGRRRRCGRWADHFVRGRRSLPPTR